MEKRAISVSIGCLSLGAVVRRDISRTLRSDMYSVRGIGVAESVRESTFVFICLILSLSFTPKRCSSSTMRSPRSWNEIDFWSIRCVPKSTSTDPSFTPCRTFFCSLPLTNLESIPAFTGNDPRRALKLL